MSVRIAASRPRFEHVPDEGMNIMKKMQKFGFATIIAGGLAASALGLSGAAQADIDHHAFINDITQDVDVH